MSTEIALQLAELAPKRQKRIADHPLREQFKVLFFANPSSPLAQLSDQLGVNKEKAYGWAKRGNWFKMRDLARKGFIDSNPKTKMDSQNVQSVQNVQSQPINGVQMVETTVSKYDRTALSPEKIAEMLAMDSVDTKKGLSMALRRAAQHASDVMTPDELIDKADKINNLTKAASTVHKWEGGSGSGGGGININILTDEVKIVQLAPPVQ